ncbi:hypothetical protein [Polystyrenella longa]|uniref:hypothetical protein n=1 Tax=Polystyrenella longa TaxID=2528007 RepID=UPI00119D693D|nr:hypothetical protein [Polystyrenella longa]
MASHFCNSIDRGFRQLFVNGNKHSYFCPEGSGGQGTPPVGCYDMIYSANPQQFDQRDGSVYAAQAYGVPVSVPLAPNVKQAYNYSWGVPSSRLTRISRVAPPNSP